jgi:hypothetical protein
MHGRLAVRRVEKLSDPESNRPDPKVSIEDEARHLAIEYALVLNQGALRHFVKDLRSSSADLTVRVAHGRKQMRGLRKRKSGQSGFQRMKREAAASIRNRPVHLDN